MLNQQQYQKLQTMGLNESQINQVVNAAGGIQQEQPKGVGGWLTGGKKGLGGIATAAGNLLSLPSYAIGGLLNRGQQAFGSKYGQGKEQGLGIVEGIRSKRGVFSELPETLGVDPESFAGKAIGFGGELLTPNLPITKAFKAFKGVDAVSDVSKAGRFKLPSAVSTVKNDAARKLLEKSYKLTEPNINEIAKAIGVTDESQKAIKVIDYLEGLGLQGANRGSLKTLNNVIDPIQQNYNALVKTGKKVPRQVYADYLLEQAIKLEKSSNDPGTRQLAQQLFDEAEFQMKKGGFLTDTDITATKTTAFANSSKNAINNPYMSSFDEQIRRTGVNTLENIAPGSQKVGTQLRGLKTARQVLGKRANTGLGTQLVNAFKPGALGFGVGFGVGATSGENPLTSGLKGAAGFALASNPRIMNIAGKTLQKGFPEVKNELFEKTAKTGLETIKRTPSRLLRTYAQPSPVKPQETRQPERNQQFQRPTYKPTIAPVAPKIKSTMPTSESFYSEIRKKRGY
jgi:hypothetical protein